MIAASELILRPNGAMYHLNLLPGQVAETIITVGDPERVAQVSRRFDSIELKVEAREFVTHTGELDGRRITVISTGIGTDNVDIVMNELDALFNIDIATRKPRTDLVSLDFLRLGTSGAFQADLPLDSFLLSGAALGQDGLLPFYPEIDADPVTSVLASHLERQGVALPAPPFIVRPVLPDFMDHASVATLPAGITLSAAGFYAPQGRRLRLATGMHASLLAALRSFVWENLRITNIEMETAGIYGLATALGHRSASISALLANRAAGTFSRRPAETVQRLIDYGLLLLTDR